jgi:hypothetical protein
MGGGEGMRLCGVGVGVGCGFGCLGAWACGCASRAD